jgi:hypothetical protein
MYHAYKDGYSTLPNLKKLKNCEVFEKDHSDSYLVQEEKKEALSNQKYFFEHDNDPEFYEICSKFILENYHFPLKSKSYLDIAKETDEDFIIHRIKDNKDWMCSAHVCFASHWLPEDKIGTNFDQIHKPVPMNLKNSKKIVEAMIYSGAFERFVWSVIYEKKYNFHPRFPKVKFDKNNPRVFVKVERQVSVAFPEKDFCLFILRQYVIDEKDLDKKSLVNSIKNMNSEQKKYKDLENCEDLLNYLSIS